jgi:hypothetical protein
MHESNRSRRLVALIAAYVVALQALLLPLTVAAGAVYDASLCITVSAADAPAPTGHDNGCACAAGCGMQCCAQILGSPPQLLAAFVPTYTRAIVPATAIERAIRPPGKGPQNARAPPAA